jgi:hypothetical protein
MGILNLQHHQITEKAWITIGPMAQLNLVLGFTTE